MYRRDVTSSQFFLPESYTIKIVVVVYPLLAYSITFFKKNSTYFLIHIF